MATAQTIIQAAYREGNLIMVGAQPTENELDEALDRLNAYIRSIFGQEMGEPLSDWLVPAPQRTAPVAANYPQLPFPMGVDGFALPNPMAADPSINVYPFPPKNSRLVFGSVSNTVYFPEQPDDGSRMAVVQGSGAGDGGSAGMTLTLDGNGRTIEGSNQKIYDAPVTARAWFYRADLGNWTAVVDLALADPMPFPSDFDDLFVTALAIRLAPRYGKTTAPETVATNRKMLTSLKAQYRQTQNTVYGAWEFPNSYESFSTNSRYR